MINDDWIEQTDFYVDNEERETVCSNTTVPINSRKVQFIEIPDELNEDDDLIYTNIIIELPQCSIQKRLHSLD